MPSHREAVALAVRKLIADVFGRSLAGTKEYFRFRGLYTLTDASIAELRHRVAQAIGVDVPPSEWESFSTIADLITYVDSEIQREYATGD